MLRPRTGTPTDQIALGAPDGFGPDAVAAPGGLDGQILLHGTGLQDLAADGDRLVITTPGGLVDFDPVGGRIRTRLELSGCVGSAYADPSGGLLVARGGGVLRHADGTVMPVAGGYARHAVLFPGTDGRPWVLDRSTVGWPGKENAHLVQLGHGVDGERRYSAALPAGACENACWLRDQVFFVLGSGSSAVVDVAAGTWSWMTTPVARPQGLVKLDDHRVLVVGRERHVQICTIDTATGRSSPVIAVNLAWHASAATRLDDSLFLLAGAPVSSSVVVPVLARLDLATVAGEVWISSYPSPTG